MVDDEKIICDFFTKLFTTLGFSSTACNSGYRAIEMARESRFDAVFLDWRMPGMDGVETFRQLKTINPGIKGVIISGYPKEDVLNDIDIAELKANVLTKPFEIEKIRQLLEKFTI